MDSKKKPQGFVPSSSRLSIARDLFGIVRRAISRSSLVEPKHALTRVQELVETLRVSLLELGVEATNRQLESWACLIYESMSAPSRTFHSVQHVYDISVDADPIQTVSALFHDVIYYSIDGGLSSSQGEILKEMISEESDGVVRLSGSFYHDEPAIAVVLAIFGYTPGEVLDPFSGLNEFLSAAVAVRCLQNTLGLPILAQIAACIEATIPFRKIDENGICPMDHLFIRFERANSKFNLGLTDDEVVRSIQRAVDLANRDVGNFSTTDRAAFLSKTWDLLPESNISLRHTTVFRISEFTFALKKMTDFFNTLDPEVIYWSFRQQPPEDVVKQMTKRARDNINTALTYMHAKLLSISVLGALAELTGGDAPIALFLGDLPEPNRFSPSIEDYIQIIDKHDGVKLDDEVLNLLKNGRNSESRFDLKNSPLAAYLYAVMGDSGLQKSLEHVRCPMDGESAKALLDSLPSVVVRNIAHPCARIAVTREDALMNIVKEYAR